MSFKKTRRKRLPLIEAAVAAHPRKRPQPVQVPRLHEGVPHAGRPAPARESQLVLAAHQQAGPDVHARCAAAASAHALVAFTPEVHVAAVPPRGSQGAGAVPRPAADVLRGVRGPLWSRGPLRAPAAGPCRPPAAVGQSAIIGSRRTRVLPTPASSSGRKWIYGSSRAKSEIERGPGRHARPGGQQQPPSDLQPLSPRWLRSVTATPSYEWTATMRPFAAICLVGAVVDAQQLVNPSFESDAISSYTYMTPTGWTASGGVVVVRF